MRVCVLMLAGGASDQWGWHMSLQPTGGGVGGGHMARGVLKTLMGKKVWDAYLTGIPARL